MKIFIFAMEKEAKPLLDALEIQKDFNLGYARVRECKYHNRKVAIVISGVGKAFAAASVAALAAHYSKIDYIINFGVGGSTDVGFAPIGSVIIGKDYIEDDLDTTTVGDPLGMVSGINMVELPSDGVLGDLLGACCKKLGIPYAYGRITSGDVFFRHDDPRRAEVIEHFHPASIDMESAPYAQIAYVYKIPYAAVRIISDGEHPETEYLVNVKDCCEKIKDLALKVLLS